MSRGRLRIMLGAAPGVGKTYAMLEEGRRLLSDGADVVVAVVETHGRAATAALVDGLEVVPRRAIEHRGVRLDELDLAAVLERAPVPDPGRWPAPSVAWRARLEAAHGVLVGGDSPNPTPPG